MKRLKPIILSVCIVIMGTAGMAGVMAVYQNEQSKTVRAQEIPVEVEQDSPVSPEVFKIRFGEPENGSSDYDMEIVQETSEAASVPEEETPQNLMDEAEKKPAAEEKPADKQIEEIIEDPKDLYIYEEVIEKAVEEEKPVEIIEVEELQVTQDTSEKDTTGEGELAEKQDTAGSSDKIFEMNDLVYGIDVSKWQGDIDWSKVAKAGYKFAMIKCGGRSTELGGELYEDVKFQQNIQGALANGMQVGVYFFSQATSIQEVYEEASMCLNLIKDYQITYPIAFDWESSSEYRVAKKHPDKEMLTKICEAFCDTIASHGYQPMIYFCRNDWYNAVNAKTLSEKYKTWLAVYFSDYYYKSQQWKYGDDLPNFRHSYQMWQYGVTDTVPGIDGWCDMNIAFFTYGNYQVEGLTDPVIEVKNAHKQVFAGDEFDFEDGVRGVNSIGYEVELNWRVIDSKGTLIDEAVENDFTDKAGEYTIRYTFADPRVGIVIKEVKVTVKEKPQAATTPSEGATGESTSAEDTTGTLSPTENATGTTKPAEDTTKTSAPAENATGTLIPAEKTTGTSKPAVSH